MRMRPLTDNMPKPLLSIGRYALIEYHLQRLQRAGIQEVIINTHHLGDHIHKALGDGRRYGVHIQYSPEEELLGCLGGIQRVVTHFGSEPFLLVSADIWTDFEIEEAFVNQTSLAHLLLVQDPDHVAGDFSVDDQSILGSGQPRWAYGGIARLDPSLCYALQPTVVTLKEMFLQAIAQQACTGEVFHGQWLNVGTPEQLTRARQMAEGDGA